MDTLNPIIDFSYNNNRQKHGIAEIAASAAFSTLNNSMLLYHGELCSLRLHRSTQIFPFQPEVFELKNVASKSMYS